MQRAVSAKRLLEAFGHLKRMGHATCPTCTPGEHLRDVRDQTLITRTQQSEHVQDSRQRSDCVSATAESEQKHLVSVLINIHEIAISVADVRQEACSKSQPRSEEIGR